MEHDELFWAKVRKTDGCWMWTGANNGRGYGMLRRGPGTRYYAHRYAWMQVNGPIPEGAVLAHRCDNPPCVNPAHLFVTDQAGNSADMVAKGRASRWMGEKCHCKHGHAFAGDNLYIDRHGHRRCRECANAPRRRGIRKPYRYSPRRKAA